MMETLTISATINKQGKITQHDKHMLCLALIKSLMAQPTQTIEAPYVPQLPEQRQSTPNTAIKTLECSDFLTRQEKMV
jgi:hypothetical protein